MTPEKFIKKNQEGVLLNDYSLKEVIWFMQKYSEYILEQSNEYDSGYNDGLSEGYDNGYSEGYEEARNEFE